MEMVDIVDEKDNILGSISREEANKKLLLHRIIRVIIINSKNEILLQKRSKTMKFYPLHWDCSTAGAVSSGESYEEAAKKELSEELGLEETQGLKLIFKKIIKFVDGNEMEGVFELKHEGPFKIDKGEVAEVKFVSKENLKQMLKEDLFHPAGKQVFEEYLKEE